MAGKSGGQRQSWIIIGLGTICGISLLGNALLLADRYAGRTVETVYDGDSFELSDGTRVRLLGVDAPETGRCQGAEAKAFLSDSILGRHVRLKHAIVDDYGRSVSNVFIEDWKSWTEYMSWKVRETHYIAYALISGHPRDVGDPFPDSMVNRRVISAGFARLTGAQSLYSESLKSAQQQAKSKNLGIWSAQCRQIPPPNGMSIKGNITDGKKIYYTPDCPYYDQVIVDSAYGDVWIESEKEAVRLGFIRSNRCAR